MPLKIGLLTIATGRYLELLEALAASARRFFFARHDVTHFVFSDAAAIDPHAVRISVAHEDWPLVTLKRYHYFAQHAERLCGMDYLFYVDCDMRFVAPCGEEILPGISERLVGVEHPGYYRRPRWFGARLFQRRPRYPFERNPRSLACVDDPSYRLYCAGGFNGGHADSFLTMSRSLRDAVEHDLARGIVAVWHDESHLNRYFYVQKPKVLPPSYCYPEEGYANLRHLEPVILALAKDHGRLRGMPGPASAA
ncbi:MAG: hypothetical protein AB1452_03745 [Pseudomonadota bacterium]